MLDVKRKLIAPNSTAMKWLEPMKRPHVHKLDEYLKRKKKGGWGYDDFKKQAFGYRANSCQHYEYLTVPSYWANAAF